MGESLKRVRRPNGEESFVYAMQGVSGKRNDKISEQYARHQTKAGRSQELPIDFLAGVSKGRHAERPALLRFDPSSLSLEGSYLDG